MVKKDWIFDIFDQIQTIFKKIQTIFDLFRLAFDINGLNLNRIVATIKSDGWNRIEKFNSNLI